MNSFKPWIPFVGLLAVIALMMLPRWLFSGEAESGSSGSRPAPPVRVESVRTSDLAETLRLNGSLISNQSIELRTEVPGRITGIFFKEGSLVKEGELLVQLNDADLQARLKRLEAELKLAGIRENRQQRLAESGSGTEEAFDEARLTRAALEAEKELLQAEIDKTRVVAPFTGVIGLRQVSVGSHVSTDDPIARLENLDAIEVEFGIPERHQYTIRPGHSIKLQIPGLPRTISGQIDSISPRLDPGTRTLTCRASLEPGEVVLRPGGFGTVSIEVESYEDTIMIPAHAVIPGISSQSVYLVREGKAVLQDVTTGLRNNRRIQILEGLKPDDQLIVSGIQSLRPGIEVNVQ